MEREDPLKTTNADLEREDRFLARLSTLLPLSTDTNPKVRSVIIDQIANLDEEFFPFAFDDILEIAEGENDPDMRRRLFQILAENHPSGSGFTTSLVMELLGSVEQRDMALELLARSSTLSLGAIPVLVYLGTQADSFELKEKFFESALRISSNAEPFITLFAPSFSATSHVSREISPELLIGGNLLFSEDHHITDPDIRTLFQNNKLDQRVIAPPAIFTLLGPKWRNLTEGSKIFSLKIATEAPRLPTATVIESPIE